MRRGFPRTMPRFALGKRVSDAELASIHEVDIEKASGLEACKSGQLDLNLPSHDMLDIPQLPKFGTQSSIGPSPIFAWNTRYIRCTLTIIHPLEWQAQRT